MATPKKRPARPLRAPLAISVLDNAVSQHLSPFFGKLPAEVRIMVYRLVIDGHLLHFRTIKGRLTRVVCSADRVQLPCRPDLHKCYREALDQAYKNNMDDRGYQQINFFDVVLSCRQAFFEAFPVLCRSAVFDFYDRQSFSNFYRRFLTPTQFEFTPLQLITHLQITFSSDWQVSNNIGLAFHSIPKHATELEELVVAFGCRSVETAHSADHIQDNVLTLLCRFRGLKRMTVAWVSRGYCNDDAQIETGSAVQSAIASSRGRALAAKTMSRSAAVEAALANIACRPRPAGHAAMLDDKQELARFDTDNTQLFNTLVGDRLRADGFAVCVLSSVQRSMLM